MKLHIDVYKREELGRFPWVTSCDSCLEERAHGTHKLALDHVVKHINKHNSVGFRSWPVVTGTSTSSPVSQRAATADTPGAFDALA